MLRTGFRPSTACLNRSKAPVATVDESRHPRRPLRGRRHHLTPGVQESFAQSIILITRNRFSRVNTSPYSKYPLFSGYHVDPLRKKVWYLPWKTSCFPKNTLQKAGILSRGPFRSRGLHHTLYRKKVLGVWGKTTEHASREATLKNTQMPSRFPWGNKGILCWLSLKQKKKHFGETDAGQSGTLNNTGR